MIMVLTFENYLELESLLAAIAAELRQVRHLMYQSWICAPMGLWNNC